ncbi:MAG: M23 family metallopeptidase [bacterium]
MKKAYSFLLVVILLFIFQIFCFAQDLIIKDKVAPGQCLVVEYLNIKDIESVKIMALGQEVNCYREDNGFKGIMAIPLEKKPGSYDLLLQISKNNGQKQEIKRIFKIIAHKYPQVSFWLKPAKKKLLARDLVAEEWTLIEKVLLVEDDNKFWQGKFAMPATGPFSMKYGTIEKINNKKRGQHRGLDIAVNTGTKVAAPNSGRVVFADKLKVFGGTVVIDHGRGIHTLYFHLSKIMTSIGEQVAKGDIIALSGNSGVSSGPHLHWGVSVHNVRVEPMQWLSEEL